MDQRLKDALEHADYVTTFNNQKRILQQKFQKESILYYQGHAFTASVELLAFAINQSEDYWVIDNNKIPVHITKVLDFYEKLKETYHNATQNYGNEYAKMLENKKTVEGLFGV